MPRADRLTGVLGMATFVCIVLGGCANWFRGVDWYEVHRGNELRLCADMISTHEREQCEAELSMTSEEYRRQRAEVGGGSQ